MMREVLRRRLKRAKDDSNEKWVLPDLLRRNFRDLGDRGKLDGAGADRFAKRGQLAFFQAIVERIDSDREDVIRLVEGERLARRSAFLRERVGIGTLDHFEAFRIEDAVIHLGVEGLQHAVEREAHALFAHAFNHGVGGDDLGDREFLFAGSRILRAQDRGKQQRDTGEKKREAS